MKIRRALISLIDESCRIGIYPVDTTLQLSTKGSGTKRRGLIYLHEHRGDEYVVRCETIKGGDTLDELQSLAVQALRQQGLRRLKKGEDGIITITINKEV